MLVGVISVFELFISIILTNFTDQGPIQFSHRWSSLSVKAQKQSRMEWYFAVFYGFFCDSILVYYPKWYITGSILKQHTNCGHPPLWTEATTHLVTSLPPPAYMNYANNKSNTKNTTKGIYKMTSLLSYTSELNHPPSFPIVKSSFRSSFGPIPSDSLKACLYPLVTDVRMGERPRNSRMFLRQNTHISSE